MTKSPSGRSKKKLAIDSAQSKTIALIGEGQLLSGRYRVIKKIGTGGMGIVYKVKDEKLDDRVFALKALPPEMSTSNAAIKRLKKEALAAIDLRHTNIMALHSFDNDGPHHFLVMEFLHGPDLEDALVDKERFTVDEVLSVARQVCPALEHAHKRGIVHRDIKPSNLIYKTEDGEQVVKIADFGIAFQVRDSIARITGQDTTGGTMHYMPPEQLAGEETDARSDQYALAATLYELLRGRTPFQGAGGVLMRQIEEKQAAPIKDVPEHINAALLKGLAKKAEDRFESCKELLEALEGRQEVGAVAASVDSHTKSGGGSSLMMGAVGLLIVALLVVGGSGMFGEKAQEPVPTKVATVAVATRPAPVKPTVSVEPVATSKSGEKTVAGITFCWCPTSRFSMGSPVSEHMRGDDEGMRHEVRISKGFWLGKYELTQSQWKNVMGTNPSLFKGDNRPVDNISWDGCQKFIKKLNSRHGGRYKFRLPTEAEWEYACRAETTTAFSFGGNISTNQVNFDGNAPYKNSSKGVFRKKTTRVGSFPANAWGLHDMHGNLWEWCSDWYSKGYYFRSPRRDPKGPGSGKFRVFRGGSWRARGFDCRSARRFQESPDYHSDTVGFRLLLEK